MIKSILACTDGSPHGDSACRHAVYLGAKLKARVTGLHVLDSRVLEGPLMADISGWFGAQPFADQLHQFREIMEAKGDAVAAAYAKMAEEMGVATECEIKMGHPASVIIEESVQSELVVLGQRGEHAEFGGDASGSVAERVVRRCMKPCLLAPSDFKPVGKVLVAYDGSGHASKALHEAIELALALSAPLVVMSVAEHGDVEAAHAYAEAAMRLARAHECAAAPMVATGKAGPVLLAKAEELGCGLIVAGSFGHTRIREMILGSTATWLMQRSNLPVMLVR